MNSTPMKVFIISGKHPLKSSGGYATYTHALCSSLKKLGHDVNIIAISDKKNVEQTEIGKIFTVTSNYLPSKSSTAITGTFFLWSKSIDKMLRQLIPKNNEKCIIYGIGPWGYAGIKSKNFFGDKIKLLNVFFTSMTHETYWLMKGTSIQDYGIFLWLKYAIIHLYSKLILKKYECTVMRNSDLIIVHYDFAKKMLIEKYGLKDNMIKKIPYYSEIYEKKSIYSKYDTDVKAQTQKETRLDSDKLTCVSICRQEPRKGINYFLRAVKILKGKKIPIKAIIVGSGDLLSKNMKIAKKLKINDMVEFTGFVPEISDILSKADVFVQPSLQEGSGSISVFEAFLSEVPVITTYCDGLPEDVENGINGILVPKMDEKSLADAIMSFYKDKELSKKLVINGKKTVESKFNSQDMINGLEDIHRNLW